MEEIDRLKEKIVSAFSSVESPGEGDIVDSTWDDDECRDIAAHFSGKNWREYLETPGELLTDDVQSAISFFSPVGFRYFLPVYLVAAMKDFATASLHPDFLIYSLSPSLGEKAPERVARRLRLLSTSQLAAILDVLRFLEHKRDASGDSEMLSAAIGTVQLQLSERKSPGSS